MFKPTFLLTGVLVGSLSLVGCGPGGRDDEGGSDAEVSRVDAGPIVDGAVPPPPVVYVHSRDTLYTFDSATLRVTEVGPFDVEPADYITDLAVNAAGEVYGISKAKLFRINPDTGHATFLVDVPSANIDNVALTFLADGTLLASDGTGSVRRINVSTGQATEVGALGNGYTMAGDLVVVADGTMYGLSKTGQGGSDAYDNNWLLEINPTTGRATPVKQIGYGRVFGAGFIDGRLLAFTSDGKIIAVDPNMAGDGELLDESEIQFWGAGVTPLVPID